MKKSNVLVVSIFLSPLIDMIDMTKVAINRYQIYVAQLWDCCQPMIDEGIFNLLINWDCDCSLLIIYIVGLNSRMNSVRC